MQRTLETQNRADSSPLYDSQTVREVLARATQIEAQEQAGLLNADQVEALGKELGLPAATVRRALGEVAGKGNGATSAKGSQKHANNLTKEIAKAAYLPIVWWTLLSYPVMFVISRLMLGAFVPTLSLLGVMLLCIAPALLLSLRFGYLTRSAKIGAVVGSLTVGIAAALAITAISLSWLGYIFHVATPLFFISIVMGAIVGGLGAGMRNWWESLPSKNDR